MTPSTLRNLTVRLLYFLIILTPSSESREDDFQNIDKISKLCRYRDTGQFPIPIFSNWADWGCYSYTRNDLFIGGAIKPVVCTTVFNNEETYKVPGINLDKNCIPFHHENSVIQIAVQNSLKNTLIYERWKNCCLDALKCCETILSNRINETMKCPSVWDGWSCIESVDIGVTVEIICSKYSYSGQPPRCNHFSSKQCFDNGTWNAQTDYSTCSITPRLIIRSNWHTAMLSISLIISFPAIVILCLFNGNNSRKFALIRNLIIAIFVRNLLVLLTKQIIIMDELTGIEKTVMSENKWPCKLLTFFEKFATNMVFTCMLLEGMYLHRLLCNVFANRNTTKNDSTLIYFNFIGIGTSLIITVSWAIVINVHENHNCWIVNDSNRFHWINDFLRLIMLITNTCLLLHIIVTLCKTFNDRETENHAILRTAKASILCMPLFGIPFLFFIIRPDTDSCNAEQTYYFISYAFEGLQGVFVSCFHCYCNRDIQKFMIRKFYKIKEKYWSDDDNNDVRKQRRSTWSTILRKSTLISTDGANEIHTRSSDFQMVDLPSVGNYRNNFGNEETTDRNHSSREIQEGDKSIFFTLVNLTPERTDLVPS